MPSVLPELLQEARDANLRLGFNEGTTDLTDRYIQCLHRPKQGGGESPRDSQMDTDVVHLPRLLLSRFNLCNGARCTR